MKLLFKIVSLSLLLVAAPAYAKINVFACEPEWKSLVEALGGEHISAYSATTAFQDPHYIEARPSLIAKMRQADLLVCTGAELEVGWLPLLLLQSGNASIQRNELGYFLAASQVNRIEIPTKLDRSLGDVHASGNPHVHWDPDRLIAIAKALSKRLMHIDDENADSYHQNFLAFETQWTSLKKKWAPYRTQLNGKKVIVNHKNWSYLLQWLGIEMVGDLEPKPGLPPTSSHLVSLLKKARSNQVDFILMANYQNDKGANWLSQKINIPVAKLPYTIGGSEQANNLESLYQEVLNSLILLNNRTK